MLTHVLFADDFFVAADKNNCQKLFEVIQRYCRASGQRLNLEKSNILFSNNRPDEVKKQVSGVCKLMA